MSKLRYIVASARYLQTFQRNLPLPLSGWNFFLSSAQYVFISQLSISDTVEI